MKLHPSCVECSSFIQIWHRLSDVLTYSYLGVSCVLMHLAPGWHNSRATWRPLDPSKTECLMLSQASDRRMSPDPSVFRLWILWTCFCFLLGIACARRLNFLGKHCAEEMVERCHSEATSFELTRTVLGWMQASLHTVAWSHHKRGSVDMHSEVMEWINCMKTAWESSESYKSVAIRA